MGWIVGSRWCLVLSIEVFEGSGLVVNGGKKG